MADEHEAFASSRLDLWLAGRNGARGGGLSIYARLQESAAAGSLNSGA